MVIFLSPSPLLPNLHLCKISLKGTFETFLRIEKQAKEHRSISSKH